MQKYGKFLMVMLITTILLVMVFACGEKTVKKTELSFSLDERSGFMLSPNELFEALAIVVPAKTKAQYVFGDNIAGFLEGHTHTYKKGQGYLMKSSAVFSDFGSYAGGNVNNKKKAKSAKIYPYGVRTIYGDGVWDEFIMHNKKYAVSVSVHSDKANKLALFPMLNLRAKTTIVEQKGNIVVFSTKKKLKRKPNYPVYVVISSDQAFSYVKGDRDKQTELKKVFKVARSVIKPIFKSKAATTDFTLHIAFGFTVDEAIAKAKKMASEHSIALQKKSYYDFLIKSYVWTDDMEYNRALMWSKLASYSLMSEEFGKGIWAGLPWFKDNWGRDTFIALPGTLFVSGELDEGLAVMTNFSTFQNKGQLSLMVVFKNKEEKKIAKAYIRENFGKKIAVKKNKLYHSLSREYIDKQDELEKKVEKMKKDLPGYEIKYELVIGKMYGRVPNRVTSMDNIIYNTTDGTPWFIREMYEYLRYTGDMEFAKSIYPVVELALDGAIKNYVDENGFLTHDDADTWMDAKIAGSLPWSARGNRAIEIQVLWYTSLKTGEYLANFNGDKANAKKWGDIAANLKKSFPKYFWDAGMRRMADRVKKDDTRDYMVRPNQLMVVSVPLDEQFVNAQQGAYIVKNAVSELLYIYGIASLSQNHNYFHPYHDNQPKFPKDSAYHNGTVWGWNAGFTVTAMTRYGYTDLAYKLSKNLAHQILNLGCRGSMSEVMDAIQKNNKKLNLTGTYAQAWSVSEYARNGYQDYAGFRPNLLEKEILIIPAVPSEWQKYSSAFAFGKNGNAKFIVDFKREEDSQIFEFTYKGYDEDLKIVFAPLLSDKSRARVEFVLKPGEKKTVKVVMGKDIELDGAAVAKAVYLKSQAKTIGKLKFQTPAKKKFYPVMDEQNFLKNIIEAGKY